MTNIKTSAATTDKHKWLLPLTLLVILGLVSGYVMLWLSIDQPLLPAFDNWLLFLVGTGAATIANSTGVGGGVVFLPTFEFLGSQGVVEIKAGQIVAMSFVIQCFGMTTGSITWLNRIYHHKQPDTGIPPSSFFQLIAIVLAAGVPALLLTQHLFSGAPPKAVLFWFKALSIALGLALLTSTLAASNRTMERSKVSGLDQILLLLLGVLGGAATAFFSVGLGELVALYLFIRGFPLVTSAAVAVIVSAVSVLVGVSHHLISVDLPWHLLALIIPGAMLGGYVANRFAYWLGPRRLKIFAALWITLSSAYMLWAS